MCVCPLRDLKAENVLRTADGRWVLAGERMYGKGGKMVE